MVTEAQVREIARSLPGSFEHSTYGNRPSWRTKPRMFTWIRDDVNAPDGSAEALVVWVESEAEKHAMISAEPSKFFTTAHYDGHAIVLVAMAAVDVDEARELVTESWRRRAPKTLVRRFDADAAP